MVSLRPRFSPIEAAPARLPADHAPEAGLSFPGLDPEWSRLVRAKTDDGARTFHVLDTGPALAARGITPTGTILAVHGNPTWSYLWRSVLSASLERATEGAAWRVIAPDQLDMGFSERLAHPVAPAPDAPSYRQLHTRLGDLDALMDALDVDSSTLVTLGHDWGGVISLGWAVRQRGQVDAAITLNTAVDHPTDEPVPAALRAAMAPAALPAATVTTDAFLRVTLGLAEDTLPAAVREAYRAPYTSRNGRGGIGGFVADIPALSSHGSRACLQEVSAGLLDWDKPTLLLWGPKDPVFQDRYLADLQARVPHADLHRFEGAGHMLVEDRDIATPLFTWLEDHFGAEGLTHQDLRAPEPAGAILGLHEQLTALSSSARRREAAVVDMTAEPGAWSTAEDAAVDDRALSWEELAARVDALAVGLRATGVRRGDRVSLLVPPGNSLTVILYACLRLGAVAVVADAGLGVRGMTRAVRSARPDWIIGAQPGLTLARSLGWPGQRISAQTLTARRTRLLGTAASVESLLSTHEGEAPEDEPHPAAEDPAAVLFTSGSTGPAKGVVYTHARLGALVALLVEQFDIRPGASLIAGFAPFALLGPAMGATSVTPEMSVTKPATLTAQAVADAALAGGASMFFGSPAALRNVVATAAELSALQRQALGEISLVLSAGAPVHPDLLDAVQDIFPAAEIHTPYGMTEGLLQADIERREVLDAMTTDQPGVCVGSAVRGVRFALAPLDSAGVPAEKLVDPAEAVGVLGEIVVSAAHLKAGYDRLWFTDRVSHRDTHDGLLWHRTNDIGHFDADSRLWIEGRLQHVLTTAAGPIGPGSVETPVDALPEVARSAAVPVGPPGAQAVVVIAEPESDRGALRAGRSPVAEASFAAQVRAVVPEIKIAAVLVLDELPTDVRHNSKIDRTGLAAWAEQVLAGEKAGTP